MDDDMKGLDINKWLKEHPVDCSRGAPMGDRGDEGPRDDKYKFHLQKIDLRQGYDPAGTYWGGNYVSDLYGYMGYSEDGVQVRGFVRAAFRTHAKAQVRADYPNARFYR